MRPFGAVLEQLNNKDMLFSGLIQQLYCLGGAAGGYRLKVVILRIKIKM